MIRSEDRNGVPRTMFNLLYLDLLNLLDREAQKSHLSKAVKGL